MYNDKSLSTEFHLQANSRIELAVDKSTKLLELVHQLWNKNSRKIIISCIIIIIYNLSMNLKCNLPNSTEIELTFPFKTSSPNENEKSIMKELNSSQHKMISDEDCREEACTPFPCKGY